MAGRGRAAARACKALIVPLTSGPRFRIPGSNRPLWQWTAIAFFWIFALACLAAFWGIVQPDSFRLGADSDTYLKIADFMREGGAGVALVSLSGNLLGPVAIALLLKTNAAIFAFNASLFMIAVYAAGLKTGVNRWVYAILLMANAETLVSIVTVNKEILSLFSVSLFLKYIYSERRSKLLLLVILVSALLARWQQLAIVLLYLFLRRRGSLFDRRPGLAIACVVLCITVGYPLAASKLDITAFTIQGETGGTITTMNDMQAHFLFPLVMLPKMAMNLSGQLVTPWYYLDGYWTLDPGDLQNRFAVQIHTVATLMVLAAVFWSGRFRVKEPAIFFCCLYLIFTALTPFVQPRYQYPVYVLLCLELARNKAYVLPKRLTRLASLPPQIRWLRVKVVALNRTRNSAPFNLGGASTRYKLKI